MGERLRVEQLDLAHKAAGHIYRYELASKLISAGEHVLDVASGVGYGAKILNSDAHIRYTGIDLVSPDESFLTYGDFESGVDLESWEPSFSWDVSVSFETLEHLKDPNRFARLLSKASRLIVLSTPTRPTKHMNPWHLHDFTVDDVIEMFPDCDLVSLEDQPEELSHIFVFSTT
jgi:2-polyprenyl-3-methyl-5-hydroxy-6-metoxy-1,4-benzoquinol methylase